MTKGMKKSEKIEEIIDLAKEKKYEVCIWGAGNAGTTGLKMLEKMGISVDYYCDKNPDLWGTEIIDGIVCISIDEIKQKDVICFVMASVLYLDEILREVRELGIEKTVTYDELCDIQIKSYFPFMRKRRIAAYTCIVGNYDKLQEPISISDECDYYVISDQMPSKDSVFQYINIEDYVPKEIEDDTKRNRYCKINAHKIFPQYRYTIYFDGSVKLKSGIEEKVDELPVTRIMALSKNPIQCLYMEAMRAIELGRVDRETAMKQVEKYWQEGMPENFGSVTCGVLIREHNNPICKKIMEDWWDQVKMFSRKDQIAFPYVVWKNNYTMSAIATLNGEQLNSDKYLILNKIHNKPRHTSG